MILKVLLLAGLVKVLLTTDKPFLCSGIYAAVYFLWSLMFKVPFLYCLAFAGLALVASSLYYWLLQRFEGAGAVWWVILILGLFATAMI